MANATAQRCFTQRAPLPGPPLIQSGNIVLQTYDIGWIVAGTFTIAATVVSFWLIGKHLMWYTKKRQQRYIVRLLLMVPIYAIVSLASYVFWNHAIPITLVRDSYESFVLYSFVYLLLQYLSPAIEGQKEVFRKIVLKKWIFPLGFVKYRPRDGLYFLQLMKWGVLQYCVLRPTTTLAAVILDFIGLYCDSSWSPGWGHVYITTIVSLSVTIAMYCLLQLYVPLAEQLAPHKPLLKLVSVKAVVFLTFWQATALSAFSVFGLVKDTPYMTANDINTGIAALLETFEMMCFAVLHIRAFSYIPYRPDGQRPSDQTPRVRSLMHALDIRDMWREIRDGSVYMGKTIRGAEVDEEARRRTHFAKVMGRDRDFSESQGGVKKNWPVDKYLDEESLLDCHVSEGYKRTGIWLSDTAAALEDDEAQQKHRVQELASEAGMLDKLTADDVDQGHTRGNGSWWKGIYDRVSQSGSDREREERLSPIPQRPSHHHRRSRLYLSKEPSLDSPPPPPSIIYDYSSPGNGPSSVRFSSSYPTEQLVKVHNQSQDPRVSHNRNSGVSHGQMEKRTSPTQAIDVIPPRRMYIPRGHQVKLPASSKQTRFSAVPLPPDDHERNHLVSPHITGADKPLPRILSNTNPATVQQRSSSGGGTDLVLSRTTHPSSLPPTPFEHASSRRPRGPKKKAPSKGHSSRRHIVLPALLSPARYSAVETPRNVLEQSSQPSSRLHSSHDPRWAGRHHAYSREGLTSPASPRLGPFGPFQADGRETLAAHRHTNQKESISPREPLATTPMSALTVGTIATHDTTDTTLARTGNFQTCSSPQSSIVEDNYVAPPLNMPPELPLLTSSIKTIPISTTPPSSPLSPRRLRHTRGDVGVGRRPWS